MFNPLSYVSSSNMSNHLWVFCYLLMVFPPQTQSHVWRSSRLFPPNWFLIPDQQSLGNFCIRRLRSFHICGSWLNNCFSVCLLPSLQRLWLRETDRRQVHPRLLVPSVIHVQELHHRNDFPQPHWVNTDLGLKWSPISLSNRTLMDSVVQFNKCGLVRLITVIRGTKALLSLFLIFCFFIIVAVFTRTKCRLFSK